MASILIVDDSPTMRNLVKRLLEAHGHDVSEAGDGSSGLLSVVEKAPDLVVSDINMPQMDGFQMIGSVRSSKSKSELPIVVLTTETSNSSKEKLRDLGANAWVAKPFDDDVFIKVINQHLS